MPGGYSLAGFAIVSDSNSKEYDCTLCWAPIGSSDEANGLFLKAFQELSFTLKRMRGT